MKCNASFPKKMSFLTFTGVNTSNRTGGRKKSFGGAFETGGREKQGSTGKG